MRRLKSTDAPRFDPEAAGCRCKECPLRGLALPVPPTGPVGGHGVLLIAESPSRQEERSRTSLAGRFTLLLEQLTEAAGWPPRLLSGARKTYAVLCRPNVFRGSLKDYEVARLAQNRRDKTAAKRSKQPFEPMLSPLECCAPRVLREVQETTAAAKREGLANAVVIPMGPYAVQLLAQVKAYMRYRGSALRFNARRFAEAWNVPSEDA